MNPQTKHSSGVWNKVIGKGKLSQSILQMEKKTYQGDSYLKSTFTIKDINPTTGIQEVIVEDFKQRVPVIEK